MQRQNWHGRFFVLLVCFAVAAAFCACSERRSEGKKPELPKEETNSGFDAPTQPAGYGQEIDGYQHVGLKQQFPGGIEPNDYKAQKLVNQLFNYCVGLCSAQQECPADISAAKDGLRKQYNIFWPNKDPWGNPYQYKRLDDMSCDVWSFGPDGKDGTDDDIRVSKNNREDLPH